MALMVAWDFNAPPQGNPKEPDAAASHTPAVPPTRLNQWLAFRLVELARRLGVTL